MSHQRVLAGVLSVLVLFSGGCGGKTRPKIIPVSGKVTYKGQPVSGAVVSFMGESSPRSAVGKTNEQGEFTLTTYDSNDGAPVGKHAVSISKPVKSAEGDSLDGADSGKKTAQMMMQGASVRTKPKKAQSFVDSSIPVRYANPKDTGLSFEVIEGDENKFTIDLTDE